MTKARIIDRFPISGQNFQILVRFVGEAILRSKGKGHGGVRYQFPSFFQPRLKTRNSRCEILRASHDNGDNEDDNDDDNNYDCHCCSYSYTVQLNRMTQWNLRLNY